MVMLNKQRVSTKRLKLVGGFNPSETYESVGMMTFPIYGKIKNVPNHQPENVYILAKLSFDQFMGHLMFKSSY